MWEWVRDLDRQELLWFEFARPVEIEPGSPEDITIQVDTWLLTHGETSVGVRIVGLCQSYAGSKSPIADDSRALQMTRFIVDLPYDLNLPHQSTWQ
jgi:hypothetical protein